MIKNSAIKTLIIGGSGAYEIPVEKFGREKETVTLKTPYGQASPIRVLEIEGAKVGFLSRHGVTGYHLTAPYINYRANIYAAKELGAERILSWSGPGAMHETYHPGDLVLPDDLIDLTRQRISTFFQGKGIGFIRQSPVFCPEIHLSFQNALKELGLPCRPKGTYVCTEGPRLETPAEIRYMKQMGGDLVGMTLVPESFLARELEICYAPICYISNYAEGVRPLPYEKGILFEGTLPAKDREKVKQTLSLFPEIIRKTLDHLETLKHKCPCRDAMLRYKLRGDIQEDWHTWIG
ncbi:MAG: phosphorylase [Nitrospirae bacterium CG_4_9_14_3_um_filter_53_35]|nr:MAG: phosphorylase [Nitrospirae bacterium CG2_30_53_67]PIS36833.1 MAG: phosphorylase [Nitrospirae bacterium CG08_land_8_20_14_0_20_52_24]PIV85444.1 MAG: phosphorylase [Nitrospirae bacterium CG17_big_fil_post_rev_8_21_14_2_50_50_9]PIW84151.1 MAG: phosphorylase [Nitrospirae bacterium CG_4_8_14_3_um_filter_50_41]PIX86131.1 MAG: phosphorylase [Nitrospirae bacterium CG_4_10_14_3_um_filter_53_41]PJA76453.1 MAG: phosphorylase [Nitrospirae bacterium CG_4_9_14_3_um_filter_53_35]